MYLPYDPAYFSFLHMYRPQNDVVAQLILQSGMEGIDRVEISKHLGINAKTKAGLVYNGILWKNINPLMNFHSFPDLKI